MAVCKTSIELIELRIVARNMQALSEPYNCVKEAVNVKSTPLGKQELFLGHSNELRTRSSGSTTGAVERMKRGGGNANIRKITDCAVALLVCWLLVAGKNQCQGCCVLLLVAATHHQQTNHQLE